MAGEGMVAVMQGLRDCGLAVALLDEEGKTYTLVPKVVDRKTTSTAAMPSQCDAGAQATDGRYATVYKVHHCKLTPTSPPDQLPEFPPQRAELYPGHDNFEVGGTGSGETYNPVKTSCYRGGLCWTDRGSVCSPRPSRDPDAFANSLRKYPASPDRSAEIVERMVNYSRYNSYNRPHRHYSPPCRTCDHVSSHCSTRSSRHSYEPNISVRRQRSPEEYPTRERRYDEEVYRKSTFCKNSDVRVVRDISKKLKESIKSMSNYVAAPYTNHIARDIYKEPPLENLNVVNTEIQAAASMVSRKVCTVPQPVPIKRTVAIPLSPASSQSRNDEAANLPVDIDPSVTRSVQTVHRLGTSVHTSTSHTGVPNKLMITRKSKSFTDFGVDKELKMEILEWLNDASDPRMKRIQDSVLKKLSNRLKRIPGVKIERLKKDWERKDNFFKKSMANELRRMHAQCGNVCKSAEMLRTKIDNEKKNFDNVREWINEVPVKKLDLLRPVIREQNYNTFVKTKAAVNKSAYNRKQSLKGEILELLVGVPIDYQGLNKTIYLNTLVDALITKLDNISEDLTEDKHVHNKNLDQLIPLSPKYYSESTVKDKPLKLERTANKTKIVTRDFQEVETDLSDTTLIDSTDEDHCYKHKTLTDKVAALLNNVTKLQKDNAVEFATQSQENLEDRLNEKRHVMETQPETVLILQNTATVNFLSNHANKTEEHIPVVDRIDLGYLKSSKDTSQIVEQIEEWLSNLLVTQEHDKELRQAVVNDLANDIMDRQKYLELSNNKCSDIDELEHLKYQIFKWINKLVGEDNTETIDHAADLMQRIKNIPVSAVSTQDKKTRTKCVGCRLCQNEVECNDYIKTTIDTSINALNYWKDSQHCQISVNRQVQTIFTAKNSQFNINGSEVNNSQMAGPSGFGSRSNNQNCFLYAQSNQANSSNDNKPTPSLTPPCCQGVPPGTPSVKQLNDEYEAFVSNWVKEIPIPSSTPSEAAMAERARLGIENGIWKAITKMKFEPATFHNKFLYEDVLEEEIDELLDLLPQTPELQQKRHLLKVRLIEKTSETNEILIELASPATYKQQLVEQVSGSLPRRVVKTDEEDPNKLFEEMLILCIADDFILATRYKDEDKVKSNAYRNKLIRKIEAIIDEVKKTSGKEAIDFNSELCVNDVISALHKVPLPTEETIRQEADEILLGLEIERWFNDLPIIKNDDKAEQLHRRRLRDALTKKLHDIEKEVNIADCTGEPHFKHEISMFLEKLPLEKDENLNINVMVNELTNRMKNREKAAYRSKAVAFQDGQQEYVVSQGPGQGRFRQQSWSDSISPGSEFDAFSNQVPACSSKITSDTVGPGMGFDTFSNQVPACSSKIMSDSTSPERGFDTFSNEVPACSSMINPPPEPRYYNDDYKQWGLDSKQSQKWYSFDTQGNPKESSALVYVPGQFQEETLGGRFGYPHGQMPKRMSSQRYAHEQPGMQHSYPSQNSAMGSMPSGQAGMPPACSGMSQNMNPVSATPYNRQDMPSFRRFNDPPPMNEPSGEFVSLLHKSNPPPMQSFVPQPRISSPQRPHFNNTAAHHSQNGSQLGASPTRPDQLPVASFANPDMSQGQPTIYKQLPDMPSFRRFNEPPPQTYEPSEYVSLLHDSKPPQSFVSQPRTPSKSPQRYDPYAPPPDQTVEGFGYNNTQAPSCYQRGVSPSRADRPESQPPNFVEGRTNQDLPSIYNQRKPNVSQAEQSEPPGFNQSLREANQDGGIPQEPQSRSLHQTPNSNNASNRDGPTSGCSQEQRFLAPKQSSSGMSISNQPAGFSTPNQRVTNAQPPNVKARRQIEKKSRRVDSGTDDDGEEIRVRCECVERVRRCKKQRVCFGCDPSLDFPYYFPMGCPYPYFFNGR